MRQQHVGFDLRMGFDRYSLPRDQLAVRKAEHAGVQLRKDQTPGVVMDDLKVLDFREQPQNAARLRSFRRVVITGDDDDARLWRFLVKARELPKRIGDGGVRRTDRVKDVTRDQ